MGRARVCGKICHRARRHLCKCWCGGLFHGKNGEAAREAFASEWGSDPKQDTSASGGDRWARAIARAQEAKTGQTPLAGVA